MKKKEEVIKEAWGEYYEIVKDKLSTNGWCIDYKYTLFSELKIYDNDERFDFVHNGEWDCCEVEKYRPKSLQGIEDNNGWTAMNGLARECPENVFLEFYNYKTKEHYISYPSEFIEIGRFTHYKIIEKSKLPIHL